MRRILIAIAASGILLSACSTAPDKISANYVSPLQYANYDCIQTREELLRVFSRVNSISGMQSTRAKNDVLAVGVGMVVFWPALFLVAGGDLKTELASLKGQYEALSKVAIEKRCPIAAELGGQEKL